MALLLLAPCAASAADYSSNTLNGNWGAGSSWTGNIVPPAADNAYISANNIVNVTDGQAINYLRIRAQNGTVNVTGAGAELTVLRAYIGEVTGTGALNVTNGGTFTNTGQMFIGTDGPNGRGATGHVYVSGLGSSLTSSTIYIGATQTSDTGSARNHGVMHVFDQASVTTGGMVVGGGYFGNNDSGELKVYGSGTHLTVNSYLSIAETALSTGYVEISDGATATVNGNITVGSEGTGRLSVHDATFFSTGDIALGGRPALPVAWLDIQNSTFTANNIHAFGHSTDKLNILGPGSDITFTTSFGPGGDANPFIKYFYVDSAIDSSNDTSIIDVKGYALIGGDSYVAAMGSALQKSDNTFDLYYLEQRWFDGTVSAPEIKVVDYGIESGTVTVGFDFDAGGVPTWDISQSLIFTPSAERGEEGWVKIINAGDSDIIATFVDSNSALNETAYDAFLKYLASGLEGTGLSLTVLSHSADQLSVSFSSDPFTSGAFDVYGWGLDYFNDLWGANVRLQDLRTTITPEPATWIMLLLGLLAVARLRRRR